MKPPRIVALALVLVVGGLVGTLDLIVGPPEPAAVTDLPLAAEVLPEFGQFACPAAGADGETELSLTVTHPSVGEEAAGVEVITVDDGHEQTVTRADLSPDSLRTFDPEGVPVVRWSTSPVVAHREWSYAAGDLPPGIVAGGCATTVAEQWYVPGLSTVGGGEARLRFVNPFRASATVAISFLTPEGIEEPLALQNVSVPPRSTHEIVVNESLPERQDLAAVIDVRSGRVAAEGVQLMRSAIGGIDGVSLLQAADASAETWTVPWTVDAEGRSSWLWIANPSERVAAVELTFHTPGGGVVPDGLTEVVVDPGQLRRIDLRGTFPAGVEVAGITARSDGAPIVVSGATEVDDEEAARTGFAVQLGATDTDELWVVSGGATAGRAEQLHLANPGSSTATVDLAVITDSGVRRPSPLQNVSIAAGASWAVELTEYLGDTDAWSVVVSAEGGVVAGRVGGAGVGQRQLVALTGSPGSVWLPDGSPLASVRVAELVQRLHTAGGIQRDDPLELALRLPELPPPDPSPVEAEDARTTPTAPMDVIPGDTPGQDIDDEEDGEGVADADAGTNDDADAAVAD